MRTPAMLLTSVVLGVAATAAPATAGTLQCPEGDRYPGRTPDAYVCTDQYGPGPFDFCLYWGIKALGHPVEGEHCP